MTHPKRRDIEFPTLDGTTLRGWFYPTGQNAPSIILVHGLACLKEWYFDTLAEYFQSHGVSVLLYDHRNFGTSSGTPRHEIDPNLQQSDVHDAVTYLLSLPEQVDPTKLAALGYSYGSAHCVRTATLDRRVKAVVSLASLTNGEWLLNWAHPDRDAWDRRIFADRIARVGGSEPEYIRVSPEVGEDMQEAEKTSFMAAPDGAEFYSRMKAEVTPQWENKLTLQSVFWVRGYQMESSLPTLAPTPWLMLVDERSVEMYRPVWDKSTGPKEWGVIPGAHFDVVQGEGLVKAFELSLDFLKRHLGF
ncbi:uncharacterized protein H6S33_010232 [Morchella sextelata]|uniref:uncharacterized protein n=1 Tax=Morchella sextelata TaxID=1174677 RepID=UPI001D04ED6A|nr:uncharacterized protein H6S33_010232 [Morchella sextelata]KAH0612180.1 hypothetical protein H6S33_010232 [Morchella sextelata]